MSVLGERLRNRLAAEPATAPIEGDVPAHFKTLMKPAAVLIALTDRPDPGVLLTLRRDHLRSHAGQVAFPGGRIEQDEDAIAAALREAHEEIMLDPADVEVISSLEFYRTGTGYLIAPVLGVIPPDLALRPHEDEVAELFEAPLAYLLDPSNRARRSALFEGRERHYYEIIWEDRRIWGVTAAMIVNLSNRLNWP